MGIPFPRSCHIVRETDVRFQYQFTELACHGDGPKLMPSHALGFHLGNPLLPWSSSFSA
jgi:hypothetical protein